MSGGGKRRWAWGPVGGRRGRQGRGWPNGQGAVDRSPRVLGGARLRLTCGADLFFLAGAAGRVARGGFIDFFWPFCWEQPALRCVGMAGACASMCFADLVELMYTRVTDDIEEKAKKKHTRLLDLLLPCRELPAPRELQGDVPANPINANERSGGSPGEGGGTRSSGEKGRNRG